MNLTMVTQASEPSEIPNKDVPWNKLMDSEDSNNPFEQPDKKVKKSVTFSSL